MLNQVKTESCHFFNFCSQYLYHLENITFELQIPLIFNKIQYHNDSYHLSVSCQIIQRFRYFQEILRQYNCI